MKLFDKYFQQSCEFPDKSSQIVILVDFGCSNHVKNPYSSVVNACNTHYITFEWLI